MQQSWHYAGTGVRSFDLIGASLPHAVGEVYPNRDGIGLLRQRPIGAPVEHESPPLPDHVVMLYINQPRDVDGALSGRLRRIAPRADDVLIGPSGATSEWRQPFGDGDTFHMHLAPQRITSLIGDDDLQGRPLELVPNISVKDEVIARILRECLTELRAPGVASSVLLESFALAIAVRLLRAHSTRSAAPRLSDHVIAPYRLRRATDYMEAHLGDDLGLEDIAMAAGLSPYHFSRVFKAATGRSPYRFLTERRVARARTMLATTTMTIVDIALACGFASQQQFTTTFRKVTGVTPARFRHNCW